MEELGTMGRIFGALISKAGIPIPTEITPKVLSAAQHICKGGIISEGIFNFLFHSRDAASSKKMGGARSNIAGLICPPWSE